MLNCARGNPSRKRAKPLSYGQNLSPKILGIWVKMIGASGSNASYSMHRKRSSTRIYLARMAMMGRMIKMKLKMMPMILIGCLVWSEDWCKTRGGWGKLGWDGWFRVWGELESKNYDWPGQPILTHFPTHFNRYRMPICFNLDNWVILILSFH